MTRKNIGIVAILAMTATLSACGGAQSLEDSPSTPAGQTSGAEGEPIVVGSSNYYSNEIIAEIYAQSLENAGFTVQREFKIGAREVYLKEIESGKIDLFAEYTGPLLQFWTPDNEVTEADAIYTKLKESMPEGLQLLDQAEATDQDSYVVTRAFSEENDITSLSDLAGYAGKLTVGGNSEFENRPNGPKGLKKFYDVEVGFTPIEDKGGPLTIKALKDGEIQLANIFSASPAIKMNDLVVLGDPKGMFLSSHVAPLASASLDPAAVKVINAVQSKLTAEGLVALNVKSFQDQQPAATIAADWIKKN